MSKLIMFDFKCTVCGAEFEELVDPAHRKIACLKCGATAERQISVVHIDKLGMATSGDGFETSIDYFDKVHRERKAIEDKAYAEHGDYGHAAGAD